MIEVVRCATPTQQIKEGGGDYYNLKEYSMEGLVKQQESNNINGARDERDYLKYQKLKRNFKELREEYLRVLEGWEESSKTIKSLTSEQKFLREKLEYFMSSKNMSDEALTEAIVAKHQEIEIENEEKQKQALQKQTQMAQVKQENGSKGNMQAAQQDHSKSQSDQAPVPQSVAQSSISQPNQQNHKSSKIFNEQHNQPYSVSTAQVVTSGLSGSANQGSSKSQSATGQYYHQEGKKERKSQHSSSHGAHSGQDNKIHIQQQYNSNGQYPLAQPQTKRKKKDHNHHIPHGSYANPEVGSSRSSNSSKNYPQSQYQGGNSAGGQNYGYSSRGGQPSYTGSNADLQTYYQGSQHSNQNQPQASSMYFSTSGSTSQGQSQRHTSSQNPTYSNGQISEAGARQQQQVFETVSHYSQNHKNQRSSSQNHHQNFQQHAVYDQVEIHIPNQGQNQTNAHQQRHQPSYQSHREESYSQMNENYPRQRNGEGSGNRVSYSQIQNQLPQMMGQANNTFTNNQRHSDQGYQATQERHYLEGDQGSNNQYSHKIDQHEFNYNNQNHRIQHEQ